MIDPGMSLAKRQSLIDHLDGRFTNGDIERALGGFALMLITFYDSDKNRRTAEAPDMPAGEDMLTAISARLRTTLRDSDFLAQFDARTVAVVIPQISDRATAERIAQKLNAAFTHPAEALTAGAASTFSLKIAFSLFPSDGLTRELLIANAQEMMSSIC
jgi:GGDEF domain-containing protein